MIKKLYGLIILTVLMAFPAAAHAYNVVNLPETMTLSEAMGIFSADEIDRVTVSDTAKGDYVELSGADIATFYDTIRDMPVHRTVNPTPFRGIAVNVYTSADIKSYYINSGIQIGLYGTDNYICYKADSDGTAQLLYLDSTYKDAQTKGGGETLHRAAASDFLKLPSSPWAQPFARQAASLSLLPYEFTNKYSQNITRGEFCSLLANFIAVKGNFASLEGFMQDSGTVYLKNNFSDCSNTDVDMLYALGIVSGRDETRFEPDSYILREEAAVILCRVAGLYTAININSSLTYSDAWSVSPWAEYYVTWANENGIMTGVSADEFAPRSEYTVEQAVATMVRLYNFL